MEIISTSREVCKRLLSMLGRTIQVAITLKVNGLVVKWAGPRFVIVPASRLRCSPRISPRFVTMLRSLTAFTFFKTHSHPPVIMSDLTRNDQNSRDPRRDTASREQDDHCIVVRSTICTTWFSRVSSGVSPVHLQLYESSVLELVWVGCCRCTCVGGGNCKEEEQGEGRRWTAMVCNAIMQREVIVYQFYHSCSTKSKSVASVAEVMLWSNTWSYMHSENITQHT